MNRQERRNKKHSAFDSNYMSKFANKSISQLNSAQSQWAKDRGLNGFAEILKDPEIVKKALDKQREIHQEACDILKTMGIEASVADELKINCAYEHQPILYAVLDKVFKSHGIPTGQVNGLTNYL